MNIHLPAILMFTRGTRFWILPTDFHIFQRGRYTTNQSLLRLVSHNSHLLGWIVIRPQVTLKRTVLTALNRPTTVDTWNRKEGGMGMLFGKAKHELSLDSWVKSCKIYNWLLPNLGLFIIVIVCRSSTSGCYCHYFFLLHVKRSEDSARPHRVDGSKRLETWDWSNHYVTTKTWEFSTISPESQSHEYASMILR